ncbi:hypothetical protein [Micromonospora sp. DT31]|uniref:hypothetical protein n=1 Tax=Micromonospora sp. DT31 TaxID=3393434 RepID=UPI003CEEBE93
MRHQQHHRAVGQPLALSMLAVLAVVLRALRSGRALGMCIVVRLSRAVAGCVPAWSADRAPPQVVAPAGLSAALP